MTLRHILFAATMVASSFATEAETDTAVLNLTDDNFDESIKEFDPLLVAFVAPWCGHCKHLKPEYEKAAKILNEDGMRLGMVDATANRDLSNRFDVAGFPTIKFFRNGQPGEYNGGRDADSIVSWVRKRSGPAATRISTLAEADSFEAKGEVSVFGFFPEGSAAEKSFLEAAGRIDDVPFAICTSAEVAAKYGITGEGIVLVNDFEGQENNVKFSGEIEGAAISKWVIANSLPLVITFTQEIAPKIFRGDIKIHFLLFADADDEGAGAAAMTAFRGVAKDNQGKFLFVQVPATEERVLGYFGVSAADMPTAVLVNMGSESGMKKFQYNGDVSSTSAFVEFLASYEAGTLKPFLKSAAAPDADAEKEAAVKTIVGTTFADVVLAADKDVLFEVYAPWCGHCKQLTPIYEELGKAVQAAGLADKVVIAKMDGTQNEIDYPGVNVRGFPTILFFPANKDGASGDKTAVEYDGARDLEGFVKFLKAQATNDVQNLDTSASSAGEDDEEDDE